MDFNEAVQMIKGSCSRQIFSSFGYDDTRKKYTALETSSHNNIITPISVHRWDCTSREIRFS